VVESSYQKQRTHLFGTEYEHALLNLEFDQGRLFPILETPNMQSLLFWVFVDIYYTENWVCGCIERDNATCSTAISTAVVVVPHWLSHPLPPSLLLPLLTSLYQ